MEAFATLPCCFEKSGRANNTVHEICLSFAAVVLLLLRPSAVGLRDSELGIFTRKTKDAAACLAMLARNPRDDETNVSKISPATISIEICTKRT